MSEYRAGRVTVCDELQARFRLVLPPEHRVAAIRPRVGLASSELLVEGPLMPVATPGAEPAMVRIDLTATQENASVRLDGRLETEPHEPGNSAPTWHVGTWPDFDAFLAAFQT